MTKETSSGCTPLSFFYRCPRLMQALSLVGGLSVLGSSFVMAQTESASDKGAAPTAPPAAPVVETAPAPPPAAVPAAKPKPRASELIVVPVQRAHKLAPELAAPSRPPAPASARKPEVPIRPPAPASARKPEVPTRPPAPASARKPEVPTRPPAPASARKPDVPAAAPTTALRRRPRLSAPNLYVPETSIVVKPPKVILNPAQIQETAKTPVEAANSYIDRTDYSIGATSRYEGPASVIVTAPSTGCSTVSPNGQLSSGACGVAAPSQRIARQRIAGQPIARQRIAPQRIASQRIARQPTAGQRIARQPIASQQFSIKQFVASQPIASQQFASQPIAIKQITTKQFASQPTASQPTANSGRIIQGPQLSGVIRLAAPPVAEVEPVEITPVKMATSVIRTTRRMKYSGGGQTAPSSPSYYSSSSPATPSGPSYYSGGGQTTPSGLSYYNLTTRPAGRPSIGKNSFMFPLTMPAAISSVFGWRLHPITGDYRFHAGTDLAAPQGTPVIAAASGQVVTADFLGGYGLTVILQHEQGTQESLYAHLSEIFVLPGDPVEQGTVIGRVGNTGDSTGSHLHFEWRHLTPNGWVAVDAGLHLEYALAQLINALQVAQVTSPRGF